MTSLQHGKLHVCLREKEEEKKEKKEKPGLTEQRCIAVKVQVITGMNLSSIYILTCQLVMNILCGNITWYFCGIRGIQHVAMCCYSLRGF